MMAHLHPRYGSILEMYENLPMPNEVDGLNNLGRGHQSNISIQIYRENKPCPQAAMFFATHDGLNNLGRGSSGPVVSD